MNVVRKTVFSIMQKVQAMKHSLLLLTALLSSIAYACEKKDDNTAQILKDFSTEKLSILKTSVSKAHTFLKNLPKDMKDPDVTEFKKTIFRTETGIKLLESPHIAPTKEQIKKTCRNYNKLIILHMKIRENMKKKKKQNSPTTNVANSVASNIQPLLTSNGEQTSSSSSSSSST